MDISVHHAMLPHTDPEASLAFYRDALGLELKNDVGYEGMRWLTLGPPAGGTTIVLYPPTADPGVTPEEQAMILEMMAKGTYASITLVTPDLDATFAQLQATDIEIVQEPIDQPYGVRDAALRDPAGNLIRLNQAA